MTNHAALNTDREIWRERPDDYYSDSVHVTTGGGIGINAGGRVVVLTPAAWIALAWPKDIGVVAQASSEQRDRIVRWLRECQALLAEPTEVPELEALIAVVAAQTSSPTPEPEKQP